MAMKDAEMIDTTVVRDMLVLYNLEHDRKPNRYPGLNTLSILREVSVTGPAWEDAL